MHYASDIHILLYTYIICDINIMCVQIHKTWEFFFIIPSFANMSRFSFERKLIIGKNTIKPFYKTLEHILCNATFLKDLKRIHVSLCFKT